MKESISVEEARDLILSSVSFLDAERIGILDALGRVLAEDIHSDRELPPFDNAAMDGFAVRAADVENASVEAPVKLTVVESLAAVAIPNVALGASEACRIMTGAAIPKGADAVVRVEDTHSEGDRVFVLRAASVGDHIRLAGEDIRRGERVLEARTKLGPGAIGMLASLGLGAVRVYRQPRVAIVSTGDELIDIDEPVRWGQIVASNLYALASQVRECGAVPVVLGIAKDRVEEIGAKLSEASACDVVLSTGGVSVGDYDLVKGVLRDLGSEMKFWRVRMKPGHPLAFGMIGGKPVFGLPGNPVSSMVSFEQFVRPALLRMMGARRLFRRTLRAHLRETLRQRPGRTSFVRIVLQREGEHYVASATGNQSSGALSSMLRAHGLLVFPAELSVLREGDRAEVQVLDPDWECE